MTIFGIRMDATIILISVQCLIMFLQFIIFWRQATIAREQKELLKSQEERYESDLKMFNYGETQIFYNEMTGLGLYVSLHIFNRSFMGNAIKELKLTLPNISSKSYSLPFTQELPSNKLTLLKETSFNLSEFFDFLNSTERNYEELRYATGKVSLEITDINDRIYPHLFITKNELFDGDGKLKKIYKDSEEQRGKVI